MLQLKNICKRYTTGELVQTALDDVTINLRDNEFVAVLGHSGSGKTTLLNIIGGLDRYDSGDLIINGTSTKEYRDRDWDAYRNHTIGFVFQSYNLISHQSVLSNVELALTISGVSKSERKRRAKEALLKVGLGDQLHKKPNQMSGGQMQRVAIARALINDPDILLADEPTGALDSETSVQIMELICEIAKDRLVVMVTHNPELAERYANRIINLKDGRITDDSNPFIIEEQAENLPEEAVVRQKKKARGKKNKKLSMKKTTALSLSFNNLLTKKGRTVLTSFAGSIGIIGIALILSLSNGMQAYISGIEKDTLSLYPITIESRSVDMSDMMDMFTGKKKDKDKESERNPDKIYENPTMTSMIKTMSAKMSNNDLARFKKFLDSSEEIKALTTDIQYGYDFEPQLFKADTSEGIYQLNPNELFGSIKGSTEIRGMSQFGGSVWAEMIGNGDLLDSQYDVLAGKWPEKFNEVVLVVDKNNEITDVTLYSLGLADEEELLALISDAENGKASGQEDEEAEPNSYEYDEFLNMTFKLVLNTDYYQKDSDGIWQDMRADDDFMKKTVDNAVGLKIVGIVRPSEEIASASIGGSVGYLHSLTEYVIGEINKSQIVAEQKASPDIDVFTGLRFEPAEDKVSKEDDTADESKTASGVSSFDKPSAAPVAKTENEAPGRAMPNFRVEDAMTEDELYAFIDENFSGEERDKMNDMVRLMLKNIRSSSERAKLIEYFDEMLSEVNAQGMEDLSGSKIYGYVQMMNKDMKLQLLSALLTAAKSGTTLDLSQKPDGENGQTTEPEPEEEKEKFSESTFDDNIALLGAADIDTPDRIDIFPLDFEAKAKTELLIEDYNTKQRNDGHEEYVISYTDYIGLMMSSVTSIINIITYVLIAFVAISLIVSSIMIGVITYISVLERTKEIGILRSIGASKRDISSVFNSETVIIGFVSGLIGICATMLLNIPLNLVIQKLTDIKTLAVLPPAGAISLIIVSMLLTLIAGLIPSRLAAKKDPVIALRTE